jgi:hypothetical protein
MKKEGIKNINYLQSIEYIVISLIIITVLLLGFNNFSIPLMKSTMVLATTVQPEKFTELYFEDHLRLPKIIIPGQQYRFAFTIHNLENSDMKYSYHVYLQTQNNQVTLDKSSINILNGRSSTIVENFSPLIPEKTQVTVELINKNQKISFWMQTQ